MSTPEIVIPIVAAFVIALLTWATNASPKEAIVCALLVFVVMLSIFLGIAYMI